ncbi:MAG TPA: sugar ABC transporter substrate-binding protein [bacterium]|nr:sugar ABC transporter substrate-binding protein [bacterium]
MTLNRRTLLRAMAVSGASLALGTRFGEGLANAAAPAAGTGFSAIPASALSRYGGIDVRAMIIKFFYTDGLVPQLPMFQKTTGINVAINQFGVSEEFTKADFELASGTGSYEVVSLYMGSFQRAVRAGWIVPLDLYIDNPDLTNKPALDVPDFFAGGLNAFRYQGKQYGLPTIIGLQAMYVRSDLLAKAGIKTPPRTFAELLAAAKELHNGNAVAGIAMRAVRGRGQNVWSNLQFLYGYGAPLVKNFPTDMHPNVDSAQAIDAVTYLTNILGNYSLPDVGSVQMEDAVTNFNEGRVAILIEGVPQIGRIVDPKQSKVVDVIDVAVVPGGPAGTFPPVDAHAWVIPASSKHKEAAWLFANWATSRDVQLQAGLQGPDSVPTRKYVTQVPAFRQKWSYAKGDWLRTYEKTLTLRSSYYGSPTYFLPIPEWPEFEDRLSVALSEALTKAKSPAQAMRDAQADLTDLMKKGGYFK